MPMTNNYGCKGDEMDPVATHQRLLVGAALRTKGPILELGCGYYSTPILHEIAEAQKRLLISVDNHDFWLQNFKADDWQKFKPHNPGSKIGLATEHHKLHLIGWWGDIDKIITKHIHNYHFGLVFVDNAQPAEREYLIRILLDRADVFVMHDTEDRVAYGYDRTLPMFKYRWEDTHQKEETTVASNTVDVTKWFRELPRIIGKTGEPT